jgi:pimeloyl-ACP methyl ester carboxylesterase
VGLLAVAVAGSLLTGCSFSDDDGGSEPATPSALPQAGKAPQGVKDPATQEIYRQFYSQQPIWKDCEDYECATVTVPVDWAEPDGASIELALRRLPAAGKSFGSMLINPGGPGVSGVDFVGSARIVFGRKVRDRFDIVGWDPRGIGKSSPIKCVSDAEIERLLSGESTPDDDTEVAQSVVEQKKFAQACVDNSGEIVRHVDTISTVKDMDVIRAVLGDETLSYYGASYGTYLGAWFAETFPWRVGRLVLDGAVDPSLSTEQYTTGQALGFQRGMKAFVEDCLSRSGCPLRGSTEQAVQQLDNLIQNADEHALRTDAGRELTQSLIVTGLAMGMYDDQFWPMVTEALKKAVKGDGTGLLKLADMYNERDEKGRYSQVLAANSAIYCLDHAVEESPEQIRVLADALAERYPPFGRSMGWGLLSCSQWPIDAVVPAKKLTADGAAPILVIGTKGDPATPYEWAQSLAEQLSSGRLLTWEGEGHTAYSRGSDCVEGIVEDFFLAGKDPGENRTCPA